jgi:hypothetical protein
MGFGREPDFLDGAERVLALPERSWAEYAAFPRHLSDEFPKFSAQAPLPLRHAPMFIGMGVDFPREKVFVVLGGREVNAHLVDRRNKSFAK